MATSTGSRMEQISERRTGSASLSWLPSLAVCSLPNLVLYQWISSYKFDHKKGMTIHTYSSEQPWTPIPCHRNTGNGCVLPTWMCWWQSAMFLIQCLTVFSKDLNSFSSLLKVLSFTYNADEMMYFYKSNKSGVLKKFHRLYEPSTWQRDSLWRWKPSVSCYPPWHSTCCEQARRTTSVSVVKPPTAG